MLGVCTALELARRGRRATLVDGASALIQGASRWNEGKIHLGFLYAADATSNTAARLLPGGLAFTDLVERLVDRRIDAFATDDDDFYLVHRASVVDADAFAAYAERTASMVRDLASAPRAPRYLSDAPRAAVRRLSTSELATITQSNDVVAGFRVPERSISTIPVADLLCGAVLAEPRIEVHLDTMITGVRRRDHGRFDICTTASTSIDLSGFDIVVNALWEGRPAVDATLGMSPPAPWSHRFRAAVFGCAPAHTLPSAVVCTGPFGDVKQYADGRVYLSWYDAGLLAEGHALEPPRDSAKLTPERAAAVQTATLATLTNFFPAVARISEKADEMAVRGGWVYAVGQGSLADRASSLHQRDKFEMFAEDGYISIDTAKYSLAPWLGARVARLIDEA
jgi:glycine/D-amino acid oxidase-like deaminating enzyme